MIVRLPTKFGQGHADAIAFLQDEILPPLIGNKIVCLVIRGFLDSGNELDFVMLDTSGERQHNSRLLGLVTEMQAELSSEIRSQRQRP